MARRDPSKLKTEATRALDKGKYRKALECYLELEQLESRDGAWSRRAADMHRRLGDNAGCVAALQRAAERYAAAGFLVKAVAVCKMILAAEPGHTAALERLAELNAERGIPAPRKRPPPPLAAEAPAAAPPPIPLGAPPANRTIPPGAPLESVHLADVVADARPERNADGSASGITLIPLELELDLAEELEELQEDLEEERTREARRQAARALHVTPLFSALSPAALQRLIEAALLVELEAGQRLFGEGEAGRTLYVVASGEVAVVSEGPPRVQLSRLGEGAFFGEIALVTEQPRSATIEATEPAELLAIDRDVIGDLVEDEPAVLKILLRFLRDRLVDRLVTTSPLFGPFGGDEARELAGRFEFLECESGTVLVTQGSRSDALYLLLSGQAEVMRAAAEQRQRLATLGGGDLCGEMSLLTHEPAVATVKLTTKAFALRLPAATFREVIMTHPQVLVFVNDLAEERRRKLGAIAAGTADYAEGHLELI
jgi:CRP-like cAMP-binding protein